MSVGVNDFEFIRGEAQQWQGHCMQALKRSFGAIRERAFGGKGLLPGQVGGGFHSFVMRKNWFFRRLCGGNGGG